MEWFRLEEVEDALNEHAVDDPEEVASMVDTWVTLLFLNISLFFFFVLSFSLSHTQHTLTITYRAVNCFSCIYLTLFLVVGRVCLLCGP